MNQVQRTVRFFTLRAKRQGDPEADLDLEAAWVALAKLSQTKPSSAVTPVSKTKQLSVVCVVRSDGSVDGTLRYDRVDDLPVISNALTDDERPATESDDERLREKTHFVWWNAAKWPSASGHDVEPLTLLAVEFNSRGPRPSAIERALRALAPDCGDVTLLPLVTPGALELMQIGQPFKSLRVSTSPYAVGDLNVEGLDGFGDDVDGTGACTVELRYKPAARRRMTWTKDLVAKLRKLVGKVGKKESEGTELWSLAVETEDGQLLALDEAKAMAHVVASLESPLTKAVDSDSMRQAIRDAFGKSKASLIATLGRTLS